MQRAFHAWAGASDRSWKAEAVKYEDAGEDVEDDDRDDNGSSIRTQVDKDKDKDKDEYKVKNIGPVWRHRWTQNDKDLHNSDDVEDNDDVEDGDGDIDKDDEATAILRRIILATMMRKITIMMTIIMKLWWQC